MKKNILGVITARGGSKGIPGKNIKLLGDKPLIVYTIEAAKKSKLINHLIVSTDDEAIANVCKEYGANVPFLRPKELALDNTPHLPVIQHAIHFYEKENNVTIDFVVVLQPTSPFRIADDIDQTIQKLIDTKADSAVSLVEVVNSEHPIKVKKLEGDRVLPYVIPEVEGTRRQDLPVAYKRSGAVYTMRRDLIVKENKLYGEHIVAHIVPKERSIDIDYPWDWIQAEYILNNRIRILNTIGESFDPKAKEILDTIGEVTYSTPTQDRLTQEIEKYDIVLCGLGLNFSKEVLDKAVKLKTLVTATTGLDHIDVTYAERKGIKVVSLKGEDEFLNNITGTAELALGLMISLARNIPQSIDSVLEGNWNRDAFKGHSLKGQTLGIVGLGRLGKWMAQYGHAMGMKVVYADPQVNDSRWQKVSFKELLKESDFISIHVHLNSETEYMLDKQTLYKMKQTAFLINTSRGKIVNENDIIEVLNKKGIAGYGTDVLDGETIFIKNNCENHPLVQYAKIHRNVIITPHLGGMTYESRRDTDVFIAQKLKNLL